MATKSNEQTLEEALREDQEHHHVGVLAVMREWGDALVIAFILAMFVRIFVVELFKIPTGSMTPTLVGDWVAEVDWDGDDLLDLVVQGHSQTLVFINRGDRYEIDPEAEVPTAVLRQWEEEGILRPQYDRILVNKFAYWFGIPERGDVVVFKVPRIIWDPLKPIYIKRVVGLPGERISFEGRLRVDGELVEKPDFFEHQLYINEANLNSYGYPKLPYVGYEPGTFGADEIVRVEVPEDSIYVLGDNTRSSLDSRYWGAVPLSHLKGEAFLRYWPLDKIKLIE